MGEGSGTQDFPGHRHIIRRPRLTRLLDENPSHVISLVAPAGYGKTTLAREWLSARPRQAAWYQARASAADVAAIAVGLADAADLFAPGLGRVVRARAQIARGTPEDVAILADVFAQAVVEWPSNAWLVIDDYHEAMTSTASEEFVERIVSAAPVRVLITSRQRPTWATSRRLLYGEIFEIGTALLAMDADEAAAVLAKSGGEPLPGLVALAEGWPAVIALAAMAGEVVVPDERLPERLYEFFAEELFRGLPLAAQTGLPRVALTPLISRRVAETVLGRDAEAVIEAGIAAGVLVPRDGTFEMHPLIHAFLEQKIAEEDALSDSTLSAVVRVLLDDKEWDGAFALATRATASDVRLVLGEELQPLLRTGRLATLTDHIGFARRAGRDPLVDLADAEVRFRQGNHRGARVLAKRAAEAFPKDHHLASHAYFCASQAAYFADEPEEALMLANAATERASTRSDAADAAWARYLAATELERPDVDVLAVQMRDLAPEKPDDVLRASTALSILDSRSGARPDALRTAEDAYAVFEEASDPMIRTSFLNMYARTLMLRRMYDVALGIFEQGIKEAASVRLDFALVHLYLGAAHAHMGCGDVSAARSAVRSAEDLAHDPHSRGNVALTRAKILGLRQQYSAAEGEVLQRAHVRDSATLAEMIAYHAFFAACQGSYKKAGDLMAAATSTSRTVEPALIAQLTRAITFYVGSLSEAKAAFASALQIVRDRGHPHFLEWCLRSSTQLRQLSGSFQDPVEALLETRAASHRAALPSLSVLSDREREVLTLVGEGLRNKEIAQRLFISDVTVKVHVRHILEKLQVRSRTEAALLLAREPE